MMVRQGSRGRIRCGGMLAAVCVCAGLLAGPVRARESGRQADYAAARAGLARIDSLLAVPAPAEAIELARRLGERLGNDPVYGWQITGRLGLALLTADRPAEAVPALEEVIRQRPQVAAHHRNLGAALLRLGRRGRALAEYQSAVELEPRDADLRREFGQVLLSFRDVRRAGRELEAARALCGGCPETDAPLASYHLLAGRPDLAWPYLRRVHERSGAETDRRALVAALSAAGEDSLLQGAIVAGPAPARQADEWRLLVESEGRRGPPATSRALAARLAAGGGEAVPAVIAADDRFWGRVALNLIDAEAWDLALAAVDRAVALAPDSVVHRNNRVVVLTGLGRDDEARAEWDRVRALDPTREARAPAARKEPR